MDGVRTEFDAIVLATGFDVQQFIVPMEVFGKSGKSLTEQWKESRGAQAYMGTYTHGFPNFGILYVPPETVSFVPFLLSKANS